MKYFYTRAADPEARGKTPQHLYKWASAHTTLQALLKWAYVGGYAFATGIFDLDADLIDGEKTHRNARLWLGTEIVLIDIDHTELSLEDIKADPYVKAHAGAVFPSSSHSHYNTKAHILFPLKDRITDARQYKEVVTEIQSKLSFPTDRATLNPTLPTFGTVYTHPEMRDHDKTLDDGLCWINKKCEPLDFHVILAERLARGEYLPVVDEIEIHKNADLSRRVQNHLSAQTEQQTHVVLDALRFALTDEWGEQDRDERLTLIMAAFHGSNDPRVLDTFITYSSPRWDSSTQKANLVYWWENHKPRAGGLTVATLFALAREQGWLRTSSIELREYEEIEYEEIGDFLIRDDLPDRLLLKSPTGTGKTNGAIRLLKKLGEGARAIFFSPSIKLCHALSAELTRSGIDNTLYIDGTQTKDSETLRRAQVLVTTLQTYAVKAYTAGIKVEEYDLVVLDECDELLSAFVRSGISGKLAPPSHVDKLQARLGIDALANLFKNAKRVFLLDGTMTDLSRYIMKAWAGEHAVGVYVNTYTREKANVTIYGSLQTIRDEIVHNAALNKRLVIACDTKAEAGLIEKLLYITEAAKPEEVIRITGDTAADVRVLSFFDNVEQGASEYRIVIYNSAMGSGVSIINTTPDVLYLIASYLPPRKLLQILNRYRVQKEVRAYVRFSENLYSGGIAERYIQIQDAAQAEEILSGLDRLDREDIAKVVSNAALLVATDEFEQRRSIREFLIQLLKDEGREISFHASESVRYEKEVIEAKELIQQAKEEIRSSWRQVAPIKRGQAFPKNMTPEDVARGLLHGYISEIFPEYNETKLEDHEIAKLAINFGKKRGTLKRWLNPDLVMNTTLAEMQDRRKETVAFRLYYIRIELITCLGILFPSLEDKYDDDDIYDRAREFNLSVRERETAFDLIAPLDRKYSIIDHSTDDVVEKAIKFARVILKSIGLGIKRTNGKRVNGESRIRRSRVTHINDLYNFVLLSGIGSVEDVQDFNLARFTQAHLEIQKAMKAYKRFSDNDKNEVAETLNILDSVSFPTAVQLQKDRQGVFQ